MNHVLFLNRSLSKLKLHLGKVISPVLCVPWALQTLVITNLQENESYLSGKFLNILVFPSSVRIIQALQSWINLNFLGLLYELGLQEYPSYSNLSEILGS